MERPTTLRPSEALGTERLMAVWAKMAMMARSNKVVVVIFVV
jgi:hypothetical protein